MRNFCAKLLYEKAMRKMLVKLTPIPLFIAVLTNTEYSSFVAFPSYLMFFVSHLFRCLKLFKKEFIEDMETKYGRVFDSQLL